MDLVLSGLQNKELFVYMNDFDIVIYGTSLEEHEKKVYNLLIERLRKANLKQLQSNKCEFLKKRSNLLRSCYQ